ncbi:MAG: HAD-IB family hydrolase [DPANN group archaeon]|nr:HAD-IB family hydrolase [DPANN group archaeon]
MNKTPKTKVAVFDFDGTIYKGDALIDFYLFTLNKYPAKILWGPYHAIVYLLYKLNLIPAATAKQQILLAIRNIPIKTLQTYVEEFWKLHEKNLMKDALTEIKKLKRQGYKVVIATASLDYYMLPIYKKTGADELICTKIGVIDGKITNIIDGENCENQAKADMVKQRFGDVAMAFSDELRDLPLLELADEKFLVNLDKKVSGHENVYWQ